MTSLRVNARMYSVTPVTRAAWQRILDWVAARAGVATEPLVHDAPHPLMTMWNRDDLGMVQMCGLPLALRAPKPTILAVGVPSLARYGDKPVYMSDLAVRADSNFRTIEDTFGHRAGFTVTDSQSGYYAFQYYLRDRFPQVKQPYRKIVGELISARGVITALAEGRIDVGPLDSYSHDLLRATDPAFTAQVRVVATTEPTPAPPIVATTALGPEVVARLREAYRAAGETAELAEARRTVLVERFDLIDPGAYDLLAERARAIDRAGAWKETP